MSNIRSVYLDALKAYQFPREFTSPTEEQLQLVAPHLTPKQVRGVLNSAELTNVALPPVRVRGAEWVAEFRPEDPRRSAPSRLRLLPNSQRFIKSRRLPYSVEAAEFAERNWRSHLLKDNWGVAQTIYVVDPKVISDSDWKGPKNKRVIWAALLGKPSSYSGRNVDFSSLDNWDSLIRTFTEDWVEGNEIEGNHGSLTAFICAGCANGMTRKGCDRCGIELKTISEGSYLFDWNTALPLRLVKYLQRTGHKFINLDGERSLQAKPTIIVPPNPNANPYPYHYRHH